MLKYINNLFCNEKTIISEHFYYCSRVEPFFAELNTNNFNNYDFVKNEMIKTNITSINYNQVIDCLKKFDSEENETFTSQVDFIYFRNEDCPALKIMNINSRKNQKKYGHVLNKFYIKEFIIKKEKQNIFFNF